MADRAEHAERQVIELTELRGGMSLWRGENDHLRCQIEQLQRPLNQGRAAECEFGGLRKVRGAQIRVICAR